MNQNSKEGGIYLRFFEWITLGLYYKGYIAGFKLSSGPFSKPAFNFLHGVPTIC